MRKPKIHLAEETTNVQKQSKSKSTKMKRKLEYIAAYTIKNEQLTWPSVMNKHLITQRT